MNVQFTSAGWAQYLAWIDADPKTAAKINTLIEDIRRSPFRGLGKPEPLRGDRAGWWSRHVAEEHRLVYRVSGKGDEQRIEVAQCRGHY